MGTVFEAYDTKMQRRVALKVMSRHHSSSQKAEARFAREAWIGGKLSHPNLVKVYEKGAWEELSYFSMELLDGGSLHDVIRRMKQWGRDDVWGLKFGTREYIAWAIGQIIAAARGLDYAHRHRVIHRDIKPMNILLSKDPCVVKIADFGLAVDVDTTRLTTVGGMIGTVAYMAPEQIRGDLADIDARADVYALGVTLFELLTLELPYSATTQQMYVNAVLTAEARRPSKLNEKVGRDLEVVLGKALEKHPSDRYASAAEFAQDLDNVLGFKPVIARPPTAAARMAKWVRRRPIHAALAGALLVGLPTVSALAVRHAQSQRLLAQVEISRLWEGSRRLAREDRFPELVESLSDLLSRDPRHVPALRTRSVAYWKLAEREADPARRRDLEELALSDITRVIDLRPEVSWPHRVKAFLLASFGRTEEAEREGEAAQRLRSETPSAEELEIDAILAFESRDYSRAVALYSDLLARMPGSVEAFVARGNAYVLRGDLTRAIQDYRVAVALNPGDPTVLKRLAEALTSNAELGDGELVYRQALGIAPDSPEVHEGLADNLLEQGRAAISATDPEGALRRFREAEQEARRSLDLDPSGRWARLNLGASLMERNRLLERSDSRLVEEAIAQYERVISGWERGGGERNAAVYLDALVNQCDALIQAGDLPRALKTCQDVTELRPDDPDGFYNLAAVYALLGRPDDALEALAKDLELGDTDHAYLAADKWFESLREDARFKALLRRMEKAAAASEAADPEGRP